MKIYRIDLTVWVRTKSAKKAEKIAVRMLDALGSRIEGATIDPPEEIIDDA